MPLWQNAKATFSTRCCPAANVTFTRGKKKQKKFCQSRSGQTGIKKSRSVGSGRGGKKKKSIPSGLWSVQSTQILILQLWWLFTKSKTEFMGWRSTTACFFLCLFTEWTSVFDGGRRWLSRISQRPHFTCVRHYRRKYSTALVWDSSAKKTPRSKKKAEKSHTIEKNEKEKKRNLSVGVGRDPSCCFRNLVRHLEKHKVEFITTGRRLHSRPFD